MPHKHLPGLDLWLVDLDAVAGPLQQVNDALALTPVASDADRPHLLPADRPKRLARIALHILLSGYIGSEAARRPLIRAKGGKPRLDPGAKPHAAAHMEFSLAHAGGAALFAFSALGPVGVDLEASRPVRLADGRRAMLESAAIALVPSDPLPLAPPDDRFLQAWVRLEALAKATGKGIGALLGRLREAGDGTASLAPDTSGAQPFRVSDLSLSGPTGYHAAVAARPEALAVLGPRPTPATVPADPEWLRRWAHRIG